MIVFSVCMCVSAVFYCSGIAVIGQLSSGDSILPFLLLFVFLNCHLGSGFGMIIGLGVDLYICLCGVGFFFFFLEFSFFSGLLAVP